MFYPCDSQFCNSPKSLGMATDLEPEVEACHEGVVHVADFSAPMNLLAEESLKPEVPARVLNF